MEIIGQTAGANRIAVTGTATGDSSTGVAGSGVGVGVRGDGKTWHGVMGFTQSTIGGFGVYGEGLSGGTGVVGKSAGWHAVGGFSASRNGGCGLYGVNSAGGTGVAGESSGVAAAVFGRNTEPSEVGTAGGIGVLGHSDRGVGVWGSVIHDGGRAGYFRGNVTVNGILTKAAGSFRIDHPLDPANKYLSHSFVESPDMMNIYNGVAVLDASGRGAVQLPAYFGALNADFRYQLTAIGAPAPNLHVAQEIADNRFAIAGGSAGQKVSWQVTGIRRDAYAMAHRIPVEENKPAHEQGTYLAPKLFGHPESKGVDFAMVSRVRSTSLATEALRNPPGPPLSGS